MVRGAEILVLSTHDRSVVQNWCTRVMWLDQGRIRQDGAPDDVLEATWVIRSPRRAFFSARRLQEPRRHEVYRTGADPIWPGLSAEEEEGGHAGGAGIVPPEKGNDNGA